MGQSKSSRKRRKKIEFDRVIPQAIENLLKVRFLYPNKMLFAQVATIAPTIWESLDMDIANYAASPRFQYIKQNATWQDKRLNAI